MCRDFDPYTVECGTALTRLYLNYGLMDFATGLKAFILCILNDCDDCVIRSLLLSAEIYKVVRTRRQNRAMLNYVYEWDCEVPKLTVTILENQFLMMVQTDPQGNNVINMAKYLMLLVNT
jgi:hypothetical protein